MAKTISNNQLRPESTIWVKGNLTYSRVTKQISGDELKKDIDRKKQNGRIPIEKPYTTASICNAQVLYQNPQAPTIEEKYIEERLFTSAKHPGYNFQGVNKGNRLPYIGNLSGNQFIQIAPEGELDNGLDVTLIIRVFKGNPQNGVTLDGIILNEPVRYYSSNGLGLAERGITMVPAPGYDNSAAAHVNDATVGAPESDDFAPTQTPINQTPVNGHPYSAQPAAAPANMYNPAAAAPTAPVNAYNPAAMAQAPVQAQPQVPVQQMAPNAPVPQAQPQAQGIRYNPAENRSY